MGVTDSFRVVLSADYPSQLLKKIQQAKRRVVLSAMIVRADQRTAELLQAVVEARQRGVQALVVGDAYSLHSLSSSLGKAEFQAAARQTRHLFAQIEQAGGRAVWIGRVGLNPYSGRYHAKIAVVDDDVYTFGGINLSDDSYLTIDYMLHAIDPTLADSLQLLVQANANDLPAKDLEVTLAADATLLFDAGAKGQSVIYDYACRLASQAARVTYISQMCPSGRLAKALHGTRATCFFNRPRQTGFKPDTLGQAWDNVRSGLTNSYEGASYIHAKVILYEMRDGSKALLSGSHNFSWRGVAFGTKEIALYSTNETLWKRLHELVYKVATAD